MEREKKNVENKKDTEEKIRSQEKIIALSDLGDNSVEIFRRFQRALSAVTVLFWIVLILLCLMFSLSVIIDGLTFSIERLNAIVLVGIIGLSIIALRSVKKKACFFTRTLVFCTGGISLISLIHSIVWPVIFPNLPTSFYFICEGISLRMDLVGILYSIIAGVVALIFYYGLALQENDNLTI